MERTTSVRARRLTKSFGEVIALDGVDLDVMPGEVHGLVGPNGAGKTTLLGLLLGLAVADSGALEILGTPVGRVLGVPDGVAGFVDGPGLYPSLTARQNLAALTRLRRFGKDRVGAVEDALAQVGLTDVADDKVRGFSLGMRQRLGADGDLAVGRIVDTISHSKYWKDSAIFVVEDDSQAGADHVDGHRSPIQIISPWAQHGVTDSRFYSQL